MLLPLGARLAISSRRMIVARSTGASVKPRMLRRLEMA
jgi:hypothetical protein